MEYINEKKVAILYICTGGYIVFWKDFFLSCEKYFIPEMKKEYFVFTDAKNIAFQEMKHIHKIFQKNLRWPSIVLKRYEITLKAEKYLDNFDYVFFFNANTLFIQIINQKEFLPLPPQKFVAWQHILFYDKKREDFTYDRNKKSSAYIPIKEGEYYFGSGITGGSIKEYIGALHDLYNETKKDEQNKIIALWHDESHWNKYLLDKIHITKILTPDYLYPEGSGLPFAPKILLRDKIKYGGLFFKIFICKKKMPILLKGIYKSIKKRLLFMIGIR